MGDGLGLGDAYGATLNRIRGQGGEKSRLGMATLMWISHSERPLKANELCHALAVEIGSPNLNTDNVPSIGTLLACCQGLVAVDKETSTVRLIHFTLQEYLRAHPHLFSTAHSTMAETCLSYLNSRQVKALPINPFPDLQDTPFLEYSSLYWGIHAKRGLSDCAKLLALQLFNSHNPHISMRILLEEQGWYRDDPDRLSLFSGLHCASFFGIVDIIASLVEVEGCDINQKDCVGNTPLLWAALNGHEGVVKILLEQDHVSPDRPDRDDQTPLGHAARYGHEGIVKILLERDDIDPGKPGSWDQTPLSFAAENGHEGVVKILLKRDDIDPDKLSGRGQTPLTFAAKNGHEGVVKILLEQDHVSPDRPNRDGQTPLGYAAQRGHEGVVKILLERDDIDPDKLGGWGQTPLSFAAENGHEGVVRILLERDDVDPDKPNNWCQTPLSFAAGEGHEGMVKTLLERDDVDPGKPDNFGRTALSYATRNGHAGIIALLQPKPTTPSTAEDASLSLLLSNTDDLCPISAGTASTP